LHPFDKIFIDSHAALITATFADNAPCASYYITAVTSWTKGNFHEPPYKKTTQGFLNFIN